MCFQYALTVAQNHKQIENNPERISKIQNWIEYRIHSYRIEKKLKKHCNVC